MEPKSKWELAWAERPSEEACNFNPAFCGELISRTVGEYQKRRKLPLNLAIAFLVLPLTLHKTMRDALPGRANTAFAGWVADKNPLLAELPGRVNKLRPISREALQFAIHHNLLGLDGGDLVSGTSPVRLTLRPSLATDDTNDARSAAELLGRWFANQRTQSSILQGMGVAP